MLARVRSRSSNMRWLRPSSVVPAGVMRILPAEPEEQLLLQLLFEQQDLPADGGLRQVQLLAGAGERSRLRDRAQDLELSKVHAFVTPSRRYSVVCAAGRQCPISKDHRPDRTDL